MTPLTPEDILQRYHKAKENRGVWESHWQECYDFSLPHRSGFFNQSVAGEKRADKLFDGTAPDAVDQLSASLLAHLTPPWARWFGLTPGPDLEGPEADELAERLEKSSAILQSQFERSNFAIEMHQCYLDLVSVGTACLMFEENPPGEASAFRFSAIPLSQVVMEEGVGGFLNNVYRRSDLSLEHLEKRFPEKPVPDHILKEAAKNNDKVFSVLEAVVESRHRFEYLAILESGFEGMGEPVVLRRAAFAHNPFICFRWLKAPGESYGRSPVMKALPDIKTANKVVELSLKNASISVTGIWQADDDGVLNPATIKLVPGTIIPKAVGSAGLTPLQSAGNFDLSQVVLEELRKRIRHALLADKLGVADDKKMTATEVLERSAEMARILGATFGRLQAELLTPLLIRAISILSRRGEIESLHVDGRRVDLQYKSPLARQQTRKEAQDILAWVQSLSSLGPEAIGILNVQKTARFLAKAYGVPADILKTEDEMASPPAMTGMAGFDPQILKKAEEVMKDPQALQTMMKEFQNVTGQ